jgi:hypothetical protein
LGLPGYINKAKKVDINHDNIISGLKYAELLKKREKEHQ